MREPAHRPVGRLAGILLLAVGFVIGGLFGLVVMASAVLADRRRPGQGPALAALAATVLLGLAGVSSVVGGTPDASELSPAFAADRELAAAAALAAGVCAVFAVVGAGLSERARRDPVSARIDRRSLTADAVAAAGALVLAALALLVRMALAPEPLRPDFLELVANLRLGNGYVRGVAPALDATAMHPPLAPVVAAIFPGIVKQVHVVVSVLVVLVTAGVGRRLGGIRGAVGAGVTATFLPSLWGQQLPEALAALGVVTAVLSVWPDRPAVTRAALGGSCLAMAALARPEAIVAVPVVVAWMAIRTRWNTPSVIACACTAIVLVGPWLLWTQDRFGVVQPSTSLGATLAGATAPSATRGERIGELDPLPAPPAGTNEGVLDRSRTKAGLERSWTARAPLIVAARVGRAWDLWVPSSIRDARAARGLPTPGGSAGVVAEAGASVVFGAWLVVRRSDWRRLLPFYALPATFTAVSALTFGSRDIRSWTAPFVATAVGLFLAELVRRRERTFARPSC